MKFGAVALGAAALFFASCAALELEDGETAPRAGEERQLDVETRLSQAPDSRILVIGDSVMWWNEESGRSVAQELASAISRPVINLAVPGARISHPSAASKAQGLDIRSQYVSRQWDWVVVEGGANDLGDECGCNRCEATLDKLIAADAKSGEWVQLVNRVRSGGASAVVVGYYALPSQGSADGLAQCNDALSELNKRLALLADQDEKVRFVSMAKAMNPGEPGDYDPDRIHPSPRGSRAIARRIGSAITADNP